MRRFIVVVVCFLLRSSLLVTAQEKEIIVEVNKNVQLLSTLNNQISTSFLKDSTDDPYFYNTTRVMRLNYEHFKPFSEHPAVVATKQMSKRIGTGVYLLGLYYEELPLVKQKLPISELILQEIHTNPDTANLIVKEYFNKVAQFYHDADFEEYYSQSKALHQLAVQEVKQNLPGDTFISSLESYYGATKDKYHIVVMPTFKSGWGLSWQIQDRGKTQIFNISAPLQEQSIDKGDSVLTAGYNNAEEIRNLSVHEFGHSFVNPITTQARFAEMIDAYKSLYQPIPGQGQYSDWLTIFNEHLVRAGEIRIALAMGQKEESRNLQEAYRDWMYLPHFINQLKQYESNRSKYKKLEDFLPILIASLAELEKI
ncbi:DUF4932 domain-containing protein [Pontibacter sp. 13R65]|uniref:DUF4932 domain-containing protein n=1 Tax=Pontibacter sp. 13R65 TaxID=3127458 RepID=UPI00301C9608